MSVQCKGIGKVASLTAPAAPAATRVLVNKPRRVVNTRTNMTRSKDMLARKKSSAPKSAHQMLEGTGHTLPTYPAVGLALQAREVQEWPWL